MARWFVRICGALVALRALTNFRKLLDGDAAVLVFFGQILHGGEATMLAAAVGAFMLITGVAMMADRRWALPLIAVYAGYVAVNLLTWAIANPEEFERVGRRLSSATDPATLHSIGIAGYLGYCVVALGTTALPAWILYRQSDSIR